MIDIIIEEIDKYDMGEYTEFFQKEAYDRAVEMIGEPEEHMDAILDSISIYLDGASKMYQIMNQQNKKH